MTDDRCRPVFRMTLRRTDAITIDYADSPFARTVAVAGSINRRRVCLSRAPAEWRDGVLTASAGSLLFCAVPPFAGGGTSDRASSLWRYGTLAGVSGVQGGRRKARNVNAIDLERRGHYPAGRYHAVYREHDVNHCRVADGRIG
jgi:hypothetical protein